MSDKFEALNRALKVSPSSFSFDSFSESGDINGCSLTGYQSVGPPLPSVPCGEPAAPVCRSTRAADAWTPVSTPGGTFTAHMFTFHSS